MEQSLSGPSGEVSSPNYPTDYPNDVVNCQWIITVDTGNNVSLVLDDFRIEDCCVYFDEETETVDYYYSSYDNYSSYYDYDYEPQECCDWISVSDCVIQPYLMLLWICYKRVMLFVLYTGIKCNVRGLF